MYQKLIQCIRDSGYTTDKEVELVATQLAELIEARKANSDIDSLLNWLEERRKNYHVGVKEIGLNQLDRWNIDPTSGNVTHESGGFYSLIGVQVDGANEREVSSWTQPMIKQNECGILGILTKKIAGVRHYLLQAKFEPGNMRLLQLSPTLQATHSNLRQMHRGEKPLLAEYFENSDRGRVIVSVESVEDGGRLYLKTNRNMIVEVGENEEINVPDNFVWINLYQLKKLIKLDVVVNSLARNILGSL